VGDIAYLPRTLGAEPLSEWGSLFPLQFFAPMGLVLLSISAEHFWIVLIRAAECEKKLPALD